MLSGRLAFNLLVLAVIHNITSSLEKDHTPYCMEFIFRFQFVQVTVKIKSSGKKLKVAFMKMMVEINCASLSYGYLVIKLIYRATEENRCSSEWPFQPYLVFDVGDGHEERDKE